MKKSAKIWLWVALVICIATTILNATQGRWVSVVLAVCSIIGLCMLLTEEKKLGFIIMCIFYTLSFLYSAFTNAPELGYAFSFLVSFAGSALVPVITALFLHGQWKNLR